MREDWMTRTTKIKGGTALILGVLALAAPLAAIADHQDGDAYVPGVPVESGA